MNKYGILDQDAMVNYTHDNEFIKLFNHVNCSSWGN